MTDRSTLKLHPGSRWDGNAVVDSFGFRVSIATAEKSLPYLCTIERAGNEASPWVEDALAVIRAAGLDPEFEELEEARSEIARLKLNAQMDAQIVQAVRDTCRDFEDRLEVAEKRIAELEEARTEIERLKTELDAANGHVARLEERIASEHKRAVDFARRLRDINDYIEGCLT